MMRVGLEYEMSPLTIKISMKLYYISNTLRPEIHCSRKKGNFCVNFYQRANIKVAKKICFWA